MDNKTEILDLILKQGVLPLYFCPDKEVSVNILKALYNAGVRSIEYTNRGAAALENFKAMCQLRDTELKGMYLGVGTIKNKQAALDFIAAGADYIICPGLVPEVAEICIAKDILWVPGCMTPSEIIAAENLGAGFVKLFPGNLLGPSFMSAIKSLFSGLKFMPTGGVDTTKENIAAWFKAGVSCVGMGSKLVSKKLIDAKDYATIEAKTKEVLATVAEVRNELA